MMSRKRIVSNFFRLDKCFKNNSSTNISPNLILGPRITQAQENITQNIMLHKNTQLRGAFVRFLDKHVSSASLENVKNLDKTHSTVLVEIIESPLSSY